MKIITLDMLELNIVARICYIDIDGVLLRRLKELGFIEGASVICILKGYKNSIGAFEVNNSVIALRSVDSKNITVSIEG